VASVFMVRLLGTEFVPKADFSETSLKFETPVGTSLEATEAKTRQVEAILRDFPEVRYTLSTINTANAQGKNNVNLYIRLVDRKNRDRNADQMSAVLRERLKQVPGIAVTHAGLLDDIGGNKQVEFSLQGPDQKELERLALLALAKVRDIPGLVDLDSSVKPNKPVIGIEVMRDAASDLGLGTAQLAGPLRTLVAGQTVGNWRAPDDQTYDVNVRLAPEARNSPQDLERLLVGRRRQGQVAAAAVEPHAERREVGHRRGRIRAHDARSHRVGESCTGGERVGRVGFHRVARTHCGGDTALRPRCAALAEHALRDQEDVALRGDPQGGEHPGKAGADDHGGRAAGYFTSN
jgi:multidrug efflux pump subunit AcrB